MCLGTFSRRARSLATNYIFARVRIIGTLAPFCVIGDYKEFPITQKRYRKTSHPSAPHLLISDRSVHGFCGFAVSTICLKPSKIYLFLNNGFSAAMQHPYSDRISSQRSIFTNPVFIKRNSFRSLHHPIGEYPNVFTSASIFFPALQSGQSR